MRHHGRLSRACRYPGRYATSLGSVYAEVKGLFPIRVYLRNGARIVRACDKVEQEIEAEREYNQMLTDSIDNHPWNY